MRSSHRGTSRTTLEHDFTVQGKTSKLDCPFTSNNNTANGLADLKKLRANSSAQSPLPSPGLHHPDDPICAALYPDDKSSVPPSVASAPKCPIRFMDQHSPEEVAKYFETHKHEIPRSHEVCVKRFQSSEDDIKKLDAKYGNMVSMIQGLGAKHQPMLPVSDIGVADGEDVDATSNKRVKNWADSVENRGDGVDMPTDIEDDDERESHFDRPLREIRVGESPSRPWGIAVPYIETPAVEPSEFAQPVSPFVDHSVESVTQAVKPAGVCPFSGGNKSQLAERDVKREAQPNAPTAADPRPTGKCPFDPAMLAQLKQLERPRPTMPSRVSLEEQPQTQSVPEVKDSPTFLRKEDVAELSNQSVSKVVFNGPVFIGYPPEQAMAFLQQWQKGSKP